MSTAWDGREISLKLVIEKLPTQVNFSAYTIGVTVSKASPRKASIFYCPIRFFTHLIVLTKMLVNQSLLGNETALLFQVGIIQGQSSFPGEQLALSK